MNLFKRTEKGQAIFLIVFGLVAMMGFTALSIDGGRLYSERRTSQNAADTAAFAAALAIIDETGALSDDQAAADAAGLARALSNGFDNDGTTNWVTVNYPPIDYPDPVDDQYVCLLAWLQ